VPRTAALLALLATAGALAGCGKQPVKATGASTTQNGTAGATSTAPEQSKPTTSAATAYALAVNLRPSDLPGFTPAAEDKRHSASEGALERKLFDCIGGGHSAPALAEEATREYQRKVGVVEVGVSSGVNVARSAAIAKGELAKLRSARTHACLQSYVDAVLKGPAFGSAPAKSVSITAGVPPSFGTSGSFAWRIKASFELHSVQIPFYLDVLGFVYGSARVTLISSGLPVPLPATDQEHLFGVLLSRAKRQKL
jgi:hypothetical protein